MVQTAVELVLKGPAPYALAAAARALRVAALDHKALNDAVKGQPVIIAVVRMAQKVLRRFGGDFGEQGDADIPHRRVQDQSFALFKLIHAIPLFIL